MDPNALSNLDPKLRETYERVMGSPTPTTPASSATPVPTEQAAPIKPSTPLMETQNNIEKPEAVTITESLPQTPAMIPIVNQSKHSGLIKVFYVLGIVLFFTVYIFFWTTIFNVKLPF